MFTFIGPVLTQKLMDVGFILRDYSLVIKLAAVILMIEVMNAFVFIVKELLRVNLKLV